MTQAECREKVEACMDNGTLTAWESSFLVNLTDRLDRGQMVTVDQQTILDQIHDKIYRGQRWQQP